MTDCDLHQASHADFTRAPVVRVYCRCGNSFSSMTPDRAYQYLNSHLIWKVIDEPNSFRESADQ